MDSGFCVERHIEGIRFVGRSLAGIATTLTFPDWSLTIDLGICTPAVLRTSTVALTHGHADHIAGLSTYLATRRLYGMPPPQILAPAPIVPDLQRWVDALGDLQQRRFETPIIAMKSGHDFELGKDLVIRPFAVAHGVPALGYAVVRQTEKLGAKYLGLAGSEIARLRREGVRDLFETREEVLVAVTGDTMVGEGVEPDWSRPEIARARVLFVDATFLDNQRSIENAHAGWHSHLDELIPVLGGLRNKAVVLYHVSQIYKPEDVENIVEMRLPATLRERVHIVVPGQEERM